VTKKIIDEVGLFDSDYFAYFEESDFFWRVWLAGYKIAFMPKAIVYHKVGGTSTQLSSPFIDYHSFKNRIASLIKNLSFFSALYILPLHIFCCLVISLLYVFMLRFKNSGAVLGAIGWNIRHLPKTLKKRSNVQRNIRKISDKKLFKIIKKDMPIMKLIKFVGIYLKRW
jgi:GT2 family glycosyltransferase